MLVFRCLIQITPGELADGALYAVAASGEDGREHAGANEPLASRHARVDEEFLDKFRFAHRRKELVVSGCARVAKPRDYRAATRGPMGGDRSGGSLILVEAPYLAPPPPYTRRDGLF